MKNFPCAMGQILFEHVHYFTRCWMYYINCKPLQIIFCTIQITIKKYFHHIVLYLSFFFSMCLVCRLESLFLCEKLMACYNFGPNAKKKMVKQSIYSKIGVKPFMKSHFHHFSISRDIFQLWIVWKLGEICSGLTKSQVQNIVMF